MPGLYKSRVSWDKWAKKALLIHNYKRWLKKPRCVEMLCISLLSNRKDITIVIIKNRIIPEEWTPLFKKGMFLSVRLQMSQTIITLGQYYAFVFLYQYHLTKAHLASPSVKREEHQVLWQTWRTERKEVDEFFNPRKKRRGLEADLIIAEDDTQ